MLINRALAAFGPKGSAVLFSLILLSACMQGDAEKRAQEAANVVSAPIEIAEYPTEVYWGNFHLHTRNSLDAYGFGSTAVTPEQAFRFARGEEVASVSGKKARLDTPLDFLMVSDHAEYLSVLARASEDDPMLKSSTTVSRWLNFMAKGELGLIIKDFVDLGAKENPERMPEAFRHSAWDNVTATADRFNEPGVFTTFSGYEWTSMVSGDNLHRVVVFKDDAETVSQKLPFSAMDSQDPEELWSFLDRYEADTGGRALAIPHNGNVSEGAMFDTLTLSGQPFDRAYIAARRRWEPIVEVTQTKGDSEAHPMLSPNDEFADFETWDEGDIARNPRSFKNKSLIEQLRGEYARGALLRGLGFQASQGLNPYQFGMIGDSDAHNGLPTAMEDNFFGKFLDSEPGAKRLETNMGNALWPNSILTASGYTGIWARANTRDEIFAALQRREVYASTGPRIRLRFFGGWDFSKDLLSGESYITAGYGRGVPMGGVLPVRSGTPRAPQFMIVALKDPNAANLDRVQIIKGWRDKSGELHEKVFNVALSDRRKADPVTGKAPKIGSTVDLAKATYTNTIGAVELRSFWTDPQFDPDQEAFYYVRVLEIPTPRWTTYDAVRYGKKLPDNVPATIQERAYSSPIWYVAGS